MGSTVRDMAAYICVTCGVQAEPSSAPPARCPICDDERQYVGWEGQRWTTLEEMRASGYRGDFQEEEPDLFSIGTTPKFGIGQRALLVRTPAGNMLWDCLTYLDDDTVARVRELGGLQAIGISHPHFYGTLVDWSDAFGGVPVYIHADDGHWVQRTSANVVLWRGEEAEPLPGLKLVHLGGHFDGAAVLYWPAGAGGGGAMLTGDTIQVVQDRRYVSFMYSYPNYIPLSAAEVEGIAARMRDYRFERIYGAFGGRNVLNGTDSVEKSARRYLRRMQGPKRARA